MPSCIHKYPHGRPLLAPDPSDHHSSNCSRISVASFNLLAPLYIRPIDQRTGKIQPFASFDWISDEDSERILGNERRLPKLLQCMQDCGCDFICVQELQLEREEVDHDSNSNSNENGRNGRSRKEDCDGPKGSPQFVLPKWITPLIQCSTSSDGNKPYGIILPQQTELDKIAERNRRVLLADVAITNAIFYRSDKWKPNRRKGGVNGSSTTTCVMQAFLSDESSDPIVISSIHLDACSEEKRVQQLQRCLEISVLSSGTAYIPPCVIAGDFNCELFDGSCVSAFLTKDGENGISPPTCYDGELHVENRKKECASALRLPAGVLPSHEQMKSWDDLYGSVTKFTHDQLLALKRIGTGCTRVAYDHDEDSSTTSDQSQRTMAQWHLDHIVYTPSTLVPKGKWSTLEDDEHSRTVGLPNDRVPTDHLPIAAVFERINQPQLSEQSKKALEEMLDGIEEKQNLEFQCHTTEAKQKQAELEQQHRAKNGNELTEIEPQSTKKTKKKKTPPPPEVIQHIRSSRTVMKQLKLEHSMERQQFLNDRTVLERMVLQYMLGRDITCAQWVEIGRANKK